MPLIHCSIVSHPSPLDTASCYCWTRPHPAFPPPPHPAWSLFCVPSVNFCVGSCSLFFLGFFCPCCLLDVPPPLPLPHVLCRFPCQLSTFSSPVTSVLAFLFAFLVFGLVFRGFLWWVCNLCPCLFLKQPPSSCPMTDPWVWATSANFEPFFSALSCAA